MIQSYIKIAWRNLWKSKGFSLINICCLAIGITFTMLIGVYTLNESAVNTGLKNVEDQYVIKSNWSHANIGAPITTLGPLAKTMKDEYPRLVENYYRFDPVVNIVSYGDKHFRTQMAVGDTTVVSMYGFPLLYGNPQHAFRNNQSAVVTENFARKFFGTTNAIDKVVTIQTPSDGQKHNFVITAVLDKLPVNTVSNFTHTPYDVYLPMEANQYFQGGDKGDNWANVYMVNMIQLKHGVKAQNLEKPFASVLNKYQPPFVKDNLKIDLAPMRDYYLKDNDGTVQKMLTTLSIIASFILVLAIINFVNISVGASAYRLKEIGLRKVFGGSKRQIIFQHLTEALILTSAAGVLSIGLYEILRPVFENLLDTSLIHFWAFGTVKFLLLGGVIVLVGLIAGIYPALVLSSLNIINAVKGKVDTAKGALTLRKSLLIVQFTLAIVVFICAITVSRQVSYFFNKDIGYNKDQVMIVSSLPRQWDSVGVVKMQHVKSQFLNVPGVKSISLSYDIPDGNGGGNTNIYSGKNAAPLNIILIGVDADFAKVYGLTLTGGNFLPNTDAGSSNGKIVLNEAAVKMLGITSPIGKTVHIGALSGPAETIIGVVKDFNLGSMKDKIEPLMIAGVNESFTRAYRYFSIKLGTGDIRNSINAVQEKCKSLFPDAGFEYSFMDDKFQSLYQSELQLKKAADVATGLNLFIVFTGIVGVLAFTLSKRTKEIAVRKVLGANVSNIILIFIKEYGVLILIANIIAWPLAYLFTSKWLDSYAYRFQQDLVPYISVGFFVLLIAFGLITLQCLKAALTNPVKSLRSE